MSDKPKDACNYGLLLRELRMARGYSLYKLSELLQATPTQVGEWELGLTFPSQVQSQALYQVLVRSHATSDTVYQNKLDRLAQSRTEIANVAPAGVLRDGTYWLNQARLLAEIGYDMAAAASQMPKSVALDKLSDMTDVFDLIRICAKNVAASHRGHA